MSEPAQPDLLTLEHLAAGYGEARVLNGLSLSQKDGRSLALLGRNGTGKTTLINSLIGLTTWQGGRITFSGKDITTMPAEQRAQSGIGWVPQERNIFKSLTVEENMTAVACDGPWTVARVYEMFPRLKERRRNLGNQLSGGEQQMLAIGRALMTNPKLLVLDEATEGLAPLIRADIWACIAALKAEGEAILVIDKTIQALTTLADRHVVIEKGRVVWTGSNDEFLADHSITDRYLHL